MGIGKKLPRVRVLLTGGGTGGHIYPLIAVADELQILARGNEIDLKLQYLGAYGPFRDLLKEHNVNVKSVLSSKLRRYFSLLNIIDFPKFVLSLFQGFWKMFWLMPEVVFSKGGPGALAVVISARFYRIPVVIHESDSVPGITSEITAKFAKVIAISFKEAEGYFRNVKGKVVFTGNLVRRSLFDEQISQEKAKAVLGFDKKLPLILVLGGSQGSQNINDFILDNLSKLLEFTQVFHQTGEKNYDAVVREFSIIGKELPQELLNRYKAVDFEKDMHVPLTAADLVIGRAGATTISEIAAFSRPSILIPLPTSANNHQLKNATAYSNAGATIVMEESNLLPHLFVNRIENLFQDPKELIDMSKAAQDFYRSDAAFNLAGIIINIAK